MTKIKNHPYLMILSVVSLGLGLWLLFVAEPTDIIYYSYLLVGGGLIISSLYKLLKLSDRLTKLQQIEAIVNAGIGVGIIFISNFIIRIGLGLLFIVFPLYRIIKSSDKKSALKREILYLIIGLVIALSGDLLSQIFIYILGGIFILFSIYLFVSIFVDKIRFKKGIDRMERQQSINRDDYIDVEYEECD